MAAASRTGAKMQGAILPRLDGKLMSAAVKGGPGLEVDRPAPLFQTPMRVDTWNRYQYAVVRTAEVYFYRAGRSRPSNIYPRDQLDRRAEATRTT